MKTTKNNKAPAKGKGMAKSKGKGKGGGASMEGPKPGGIRKVAVGHKYPSLRPIPSASFFELNTSSPKSSLDESQEVILSNPLPGLESANHELFQRMRE